MDETDPPPTVLMRALPSALVLLSTALPAQIPFHQDKPPNEPRSPQDALAKMTVPDGFTVELVAAEPDLVNPIAMAFDAKGRIFVTESIEYPRKEAGPGRDRVKVLEDTDGDGKVDKVTIFADGLNIPSGIAVGYGGVWVANAPDLLLLRDTDGDLRADRTEVIATGFGREDTHELPNSLTWGPDGRLYGLNGVFNRCRVTQDLDEDGAPDGGRTWKFTCAMFRVDPWTKEFSIFCEGTSNPWGIAFDDNGSAFVSACVIDHLWHLVETGYYHRQGGPYPPHTWKLGSIVEHAHQKAAYCGITWFDSAAYPEEYRGVLYMGNIHGNCINADVLSRRGSSYAAKPRADFLSANDAWFMPVAQKTGPDGCLYVLDWYDRYHCYQDANRDPKGVDRGKGRLYRIRHGDAPRAAGFDLRAETDGALVSRLADANVFVRRTAQRLLAERARDESGPVTSLLAKQLANPDAGRRTRLHALWTLISARRLDPALHVRVLKHRDKTFRAWGVRAAGNFGDVDDLVRHGVARLASDPSPEVRLQVAIAACKIHGVDAVRLLLEVLANSDDDATIPHIVWQNLHPLLPEHGARFLAALGTLDLGSHAAIRAVLPRAADRLLAELAGPRADPDTLLGLFGGILDADPRTARRCLASLAEVIQTGQLPAAQSRTLADRLRARLEKILGRTPRHPLHDDAALLAATWGSQPGRRAARELFASPGDDQLRLRALDVLIATGDRTVLDATKRILGDHAASRALQVGLLGALGRLDDDAVGPLVVAAYPELRAGVRPAAIDLLTQRRAWSRALLDAVGSGRVPAAAANGHQIRSLRNQFSTDRPADAPFVRRIAKTWGSVRSTRNADRERVIADTRALLLVNRGDARRGREVFATVCGQCHVLHGAGTAIGPDLTGNGRGSFDQLLSNVLDPNLVVGTAYRLRSVVTTGGRTVAGLLAESDAQRVVIKTIGGEAVTIARRDVAEILDSPLSFMPEGLERSMTREQLVDLFAYLLREKPPASDDARTIPGFVPVEPRETTDPRQFDALVAAVAPGFHVAASGEGGVALLREYRGRACVVRTHPVERGRPCVLRGSVSLPAGRKSTLELIVGHHAPGEDGAKDRDWRLVVRVNGKRVLRQLVGAETAKDGWLDASVDLSEFAGQRAAIELHNAPTGWNYEFGYWRRVALVVGPPLPR